MYLKGWSTWDYYGRVYSTKDIIENIDQLTTDGFDANIIQIDGGWWTARGDYLSVRKDLQGGMKAVADYIKSKGCIAGIHLDGFRGDKVSELYKNHPDWFLKDQDGETICQLIDRGDSFMQYIYYDYSNPAVCEYMKNIMHTIHSDWGYNYIKIDFMRYGLLESILAEHNNDDEIGNKRVTKVVAFDNNMTSIERTRAGLNAMREGMGDAFFLGCSAIFGPTFGIVDGLRTGADICPTFDYYEACSFQNAGNFYLNQTVVQNDADYLVVRNKDDEESERAWGVNKFGGNTTFDEAKMWSDYIAMYGGPKINSDNLLTLRPERKKLIENAFSIKTATRFIPLDLWDHANDKNDAFNIMLAENEDGVYLSLFNWDKNDKQFLIGGLDNTVVTDIHANEKINLKDGKLHINSKTHTSIILKLEGGSFDSLRKTIHWKI
jgi:alpha-galactosidase